VQRLARPSGLLDALLKLFALGAETVAFLFQPAVLSFEHRIVNLTERVQLDQAAFLDGQPLQRLSE